MFLSVVYPSLPHSTCTPTCLAIYHPPTKPVFGHALNTVDGPRQSTRSGRQACENLMQKMSVQLSGALMRLPGSVPVTGGTLEHGEEQRFAAPAGLHDSRGSACLHFAGRIVDKTPRADVEISHEPCNLLREQRVGLSSDAESPDPDHSCGNKQIRVVGADSFSSEGCSEWICLLWLAVAFTLFPHVVRG